MKMAIFDRRAGAGLGLGGVVAATIADNFFSIAKWLCCKRCCTRLNLNDYLTI